MYTTRVIQLLAPMALVVTACGSTAPNAMQRLHLSATTKSSSNLAADLIVGGSGGSVRITSAQVVLSHVKLENDGACSGPTNPPTSAAIDTHDGPDEPNEPDGENNNEDDCEDVHVGPVLVNLPLDGSTKVILDAVVPAGTYTAVRAKLEAVESDEDGTSQFLTDHPDFAGVSVKVVGVFTDAAGADHPFTFTSGVEAEIAMDFAAPVTVDAGTSNLTIDVDVASWFTDASGAVIDPTSADNQTAIERAIRASLRAFEDDDHDGHDDHAAEGGGH